MSCFTSFFGSGEAGVEGGARKSRENKSSATEDFVFDC
jgi:hypothetical protein